MSISSKQPIRYYPYISLFLSGFILRPAFAQINTNTDAQHFMISVSGGPAWYKAGKTQTIYLQPGFQNTYVADMPTTRLATGELFIGLQRAILSHVFLQYGIAGSTSSAASLQGEVWELAEPAFNNFTYQYQLSHTHIAAKSVLLADGLSPTVLPYLSLSLGYAFNKAYRFNITPHVFEVLPVPPFQSNRQTSFTYTLGAGILKSIFTHWQIGVGYAFSDWGNSALGPSSIQSMNRGLALNHLYTHELQFQLNYLF